MCQSSFLGKAPTHGVELAVAECLDQVPAECDLVSIPPGKPLLCQSVDPPVERGADFGTKAAP
jgi:hypothetical protein